MTWARMVFKPAKMRSLALRKGRMDNKYCCRLDGVSEKPVKSLGEDFDVTLKDKASVEATHKELKI